ncbi:MAG: fibronectin type III domain-containing protein [Nitrospira sp.]|nr:fibronectin type III domain-containing protein [Nitrospira sp.]
MSNRTQSIHTDRFRPASMGLPSLAHMIGTVNVLAIGIFLLWAPVNSFAFSTSPVALSFSGTAGTANPPAQVITIWKSGNRTKNWTVRTSTPWISVTPSSGTIATEQDQIAVSVNLSGLSAGSYSSNVIISTESNSGRAVQTTIPIALTVTGSTLSPSIRLNPTTLSFSGIAGSTNPTTQLLNISNPTGGTLSWSLSGNTTWLSLSSASGTTTTETDSISASVNLSGLAAGTYTAAITVAASGATNTPQVIPVSLTVSAAPTATPIIGLSVASLGYTGTAGGANPLSQSFIISNAGGGTLTWTAGDSANWLMLSPVTGTNTGTVTASVNLTGLAAGTYSGTITIAATGATSRTLPVSLTVNPGTTTTNSVTLNWNANTETDLAGYKIYVGTQSGTYGSPIVLGIANTYQITNLTIGTTYFFSVTAYDKAGNESPHSAETSKSVY